MATVPLKNHTYAAGLAALLESGTATLGAATVRLLGPDFEFDPAASQAADVSAHFVGAEATTTLTIDWSSLDGIHTAKILSTGFSFDGYDGEVVGIMVSLSDGTPFQCLQEPNDGLHFPATVTAVDPVEVTFPSDAMYLIEVK